MHVVAAILRAVSRARVRSWVGLALLAGLFGGASLAAAVGAHRTGTAIDRFAERANPPDVYFAPRFTVGPSPDVLARLSAEEVRSWSVVRDLAVERVYAASKIEVSRDGGGSWAELDGQMDVNHVVDPRLGRTLAAFNVIAGRRTDPSVAGEAVVNEVAYREHGIRPGTKLRVHALADFPDYESGDMPRVAGVIELTVVGVNVGGSELAGSPYSVVSMSAATRPPRGAAPADLLEVWLRNGEADLPAFRREVEQRTDGQPAIFIESRATLDQAKRSVGLQATALWTLAAFLALIGALVFGQTLARQTFLESRENPTLRALGASGGQLSSVALARAAIVALTGALTALAVAILASPLAPIGAARLAEVQGGLWVPPRVLALGVAIFVLAILVLALGPAWRAGRVRTDPLDARERPSLLAGLAGRLAVSPSALAGVRMALETGKGATAVPVRTTIAGAVIGLVALVGALVAGSSLDRMLTAPAQYGWTWDVVVRAEDGWSSPERLTSVPGVRDMSLGLLGGNVVIDDVVTGAIVMDPGPVAMPVLEGRAPRGAGEIAVGRKTFRELGLRLGDNVEVAIQGIEQSRQLLVTGVAVLPLSTESAALGEGAWVTMGFVNEFLADMRPDAAFVRFDAGADPATVRSALIGTFGEEAIEDATPPSGVVDFGRVRSMPWVLGGILAVLAGATLAHGLITSVRRRRRDLAIFKTLGFTRREVRGAVAWQASLLAIVALVFALPLGIAIGRWIWTFFAERTGFVPAPNVDPRVFLIVPTTILLANALALLPGRAAARTEPATTLRAE